MAWEHRTVLLQEAVDAIAVDPDGCYVDGTWGRGGHTRALLARLSARAQVHGYDRDPEAVAAARAGPQRLDDPRFTLHHASFTAMGGDFAPGTVAGVLLDLGVSSPQIDDPARGFSFRHDAPLDMRMDPTQGVSAAQFLADADERVIAQVIRDYGEERFAGPIAKAVVARRAAGQPVRTTGALAGLVARAVRTREPGQDPATRTFQALRIHVNDELAQLEQGLSAAVDILAPGGRLAVIAFHSLEDRLVKRFIARESRAEVDRRAPFAPPPPLRLRALARLHAGAAEVAANPRARSAVLRVAERLAPPGGAS